MRLVLFLWAVSAAAQTWTLGTPADPCTGGSVLTIQGTSNTLRWDATGFTCTFQVSQPDAFVIEMQFLEPCFSAGACAGGQVKGSGRLMNAWVNDQPVLSNFDPFAAGATDISPALRSVVIYSNSTTVTLRLQTVTRSAVISQVSIVPLISHPSVALVKGVCQGTSSFKGGSLDCVGVDLWSLDASGPHRYYAAVGLTPTPRELPVCDINIPAPCLNLK